MVAIRINVMKAGAIMEECGDRAGKEWCAITGIEADYQGVSPRCQRTIVMYKHWPSRKDRVSSVADLVHRITRLRYIREFFLCNPFTVRFSMDMHRSVKNACNKLPTTTHP